MLRQVLCVGRVKMLHMLRHGLRLELGQMLHVTLSSVCWSSTDVACYVKLFVLTE